MQEIDTAFGEIPDWRNWRVAEDRTTSELLPWLVLWYHFFVQQNNLATPVPPTTPLLASPAELPSLSEPTSHSADKLVVDENQLNIMSAEELRARHTEVAFAQAEPGLVGGILNRLAEWTSTLQEKLLTIGKVKARFDQWNSLAIIDLVRQPHYREFRTLYLLLAQNWQTFVAEFAKGELITHMVYHFGPEGEIRGLENSYRDDLATERAGNFARYLRSKGKSVDRALLEDLQLLKLRDWIKQSPVNSVAIWSSPPGSAREGYIGKDSYSFTFIIHKTAETADGFQAEVQQMRTWMSLTEHAQFQTALGFKPDFSVWQEPSHAIIDNFIPLTPHTFLPSSLVDKPQLVQIPRSWADKQIEQLQQYLYADTANWKHHLDKLPVIDNQSEFDQMSTFLFNIYAQTVIPQLLQRVPQASSESDPVWVQFTHSPEYAQLVKEIDIAFSTLAYQSLAKYVEQTATNKENLVDDQSSWHTQIIQKIKQPKHNTTIPLAEMDKTQLEDTLKRLYQIQVSSVLSREQIDWYNQVAGNFLSTNRLFSLIHCGAGSFVDVRMMNNFAFNNSLVATPHVLAELRLNSLSILDKDTLHNLELDIHRRFVPLNISTPKGMEKWYVPPEYLAEPGCYYSVEHNCVVGPCGIPLLLDPLVYSEQEFRMIQAQLTTSITEEVAKADISDQDKDKVSTYLELIREKVFKKSQTVSELLSGSVVNLQAEVTAELYTLMLRLEHGWTNPVETLEYIISKYISSNEIDKLLPTTPGVTTEAAT